jgi:hypothetical protein
MDKKDNKDQQNQDSFWALFYKENRFLLKSFLSVVLFFGAVVWANFSFTPFVAGEPISASALNQTIQELNARLTALEGQGSSSSTTYKAYRDPDQEANDLIFNSSDCGAGPSVPFRQKLTFTDGASYPASFANADGTFEVEHNGNYMVTLRLQVVNPPSAQSIYLCNQPDNCLTLSSMTPTHYEGENVIHIPASVTGSIFGRVPVYLQQGVTYSLVTGFCENWSISGIDFYIEEIGG